MGDGMDLTCYRLRTHTDGGVSGFDDAIEETDLDRCSSVGPVAIGGARAKLYVAPAKPHPPEWAKFLENAFDAHLDIPRVASAAAVLVVERERPTGVELLAFTFGYGWNLMKSESFERGFGLRTSLNVVFEGDTGTGEWDPARLRSVDAKRMGANILRTRHQVSDVAALEALDVNSRRDLVNGVTGIPSNRDMWGTRVTGRDAFQFVWGSLDELGNICDAVLDAYERTDYQRRFSFIDDFLGVTDPVLRTRLIEEVVGALVGNDTSFLELAPPEMVDWERVGGFMYHTERRGTSVVRRELRLAEYLATLGKKQDTLSWDRLRQYLVRAVDGSGKDVAKWSIWRCLYGEVALDAEVYVLDDGDFYRVTTNYLDRLNGALASIATSKRDLPAWQTDWHEDDYNRHAAEGSNDLLLLDRKLVRVSSQTSRVEICDVLSSDGSFIHVKNRGDGSASLSHLFNQGFVSADLAVGDPEFRAKALERIKHEERERASRMNDDSFIGRFRPFSEDAVIAGACEVIYAIYTSNKDGDLSSLPFFSKVVLRNMVDELQRRGFKVSYKPISRSKKIT